MTRSQLEKAYRLDVSSVERLAWWLDLDGIGEECIDLIMQYLEPWR